MARSVLLRRKSVELRELENNMNIGKETLKGTMRNEICDNEKERENPGGRQNSDGRQEGGKKQDKRNR